MSFPLDLLVAGVDEAGRGPLAGPVVAAAVIIDPKSSLTGLKDSKQLTEKQREALFVYIQENCLAYALGRAEPAEIDDYNILQATLLAMKRAVMALSIAPHEVWIDGNQSPTLDYLTRTFIKGDQTVPAISAASILAKVTRDREMVQLDAQYPGYGFAKHKGYPTREHIAAVECLGVSDIHRRSFAPVRKAMTDKKMRETVIGSGK